MRGFARGFLYQDRKDATIWFATAGMSLLSMNAYLFRSSGYGNVELLEECDLLKISRRDARRAFSRKGGRTGQLGSRRMSDRIILRMERLFVERYFLTAANVSLTGCWSTQAEILQKAPLRGYRLTRHFAVSLSRIRAGVQ